MKNRNKIKSLLRESQDSSYQYKQKILKSYIDLINKDYESFEIEDEGGSWNKWHLPKMYFIVLNNFLHVENMFLSDVVAANKELNSNLHLSKINSLDELFDVFNDLYQKNFKVRFSVETLDSIETVGLFLKNNRNLYSEYYSKRKFSFLK